jgi:deoxycytidine triphosphate deaminase
MTQSYSNSNVEIWAKQDIEQAIDRGQLILNSTKNCLQACSYDLRIGTIFRDGQIINDSHSEANKNLL